VYTELAFPYGFAFSSAIASSSVPTRTIDSTGPKISSRAAGISPVT